MWNPVDVFSDDWPSWLTLTFKDLSEELFFSIENVLTLRIAKYVEVLKYVGNVCRIDRSHCRKFLN